MTTKTTITLSPIKRCHTSPNLKKRRITSILTNRKYQTKLSLTLPYTISSPTTMTIVYEKQHNLPDIVNDVLIQQQRREAIHAIATMLRKVGDQIDDQLQVKYMLEIFYYSFFIFCCLDERFFIFIYKSYIWPTNHHIYKLFIPIFTFVLLIIKSYSLFFGPVNF